MKLHNKYFLFFIIFSGILLLFVSCKTTKKREDVSKAGKYYQNTTSYYNAFFNANEIYQNSINNLLLSYKDDYQKILPLYPSRVTENPKAVAQDMDKIVEKMSRMINLKRASDWVDDGYLMIGKAQYLKQDFEKAQKTFEYFSEEMNPVFKKNLIKANKKGKSETKNSKKKKNSKKSKKKNVQKKNTHKNEKQSDSKIDTKSGTLVKHKVGKTKDWETFNEGLIWLAKTYIERDKFAGANFLIRKLENEVLPDNLKKDLYILKTYYFLDQKNYENAINPLAQAVNFTKSGKEKARYCYILGQLYEKAGNNQKAFEYFKMVGEENPDYDLEFNAKLKLLENYSGKSENYAVKELKSFLKEDKYAEYQDIIYYSIGQTYLNQKNNPLAIENFNSSIRKNKNNNPLKTDVYLKLADLKFENQEYVAAKKYLDSCLTFLPKTDERYNEVSNLSLNISDIAHNLEIISMQDSLIKISKMSKEEQLVLATSIKKKQIEDEANRRKAEIANRKENNRISPAGQTEMQAGGGALNRSMEKTLSSSFFAYNETVRQAGISDFTKKWGNIRLEDNWRRYNKSSSDISDDEKVAEEEIKLTEVEVNSILGNFPKTPEQLTDAENKIKSAMLQLGVLYREKLNNNEKSIEILERLISKYEGFAEECNAMYYLQMSYKNSGNFPDAEAWISKMQTKYPDCIYTKILTDSDFAKNANKAQDTKLNYYNSIFEAFTNENYIVAQNLLDKAPNDLYQDATYKIKMELLRAKMIGQSKGKDQYILALEDFLKLYPDSKEAINVRETLRFLKGEKDTFSKLIYEEQQDEFTYEGDKMHYILVLIRNMNDQEIEAVKSNISNYNNTYYKLERLKLSNIYFDTKGTDQIILIRKFDTAEAALKYYGDTKKNGTDFIKADANFEIYAISQSNYREVIKQKTLENYKDFFEKNYLKINKK
jgi:tetratricopeptide (TPR) repeat protein